MRLIFGKCPNKGPDILKLAAVRAGRQVQLVAVDAGRRLKCRLMAMGLIRGRRIDVISNSRHGPMMIAFGDCRMTLGRGEAEKLVVHYC